MVGVVSIVHQDKWTRACRGVHAYDRTRFYSRAFRAMRVAQGCTFPVFAHDTANLSLRVRKCVSACTREHMCDLAAVNRVFIVAATWQYMRTLDVILYRGSTEMDRDLVSVSVLPLAAHAMNRVFEYLL